MTLRSDALRSGPSCSPAGIVKLPVLGSCRPAMCLVGLLALTVALLPASSLAGQVGSRTAGGNPAHGKAVFEERCSGCHALSENRFGPRLGDVYGRRAGTVPGFGYSQALQRQPITWSAAALDRWLAGPALFLPGARMVVSVDDATGRADVIAYLRSRPASDPE